MLNTGYEIMEPSVRKKTLILLSRYRNFDFCREIESAIHSRSKSIIEYQNNSLRVAWNLKNNKNINIINVDLDVRKPFQKIFNKSNDYIENSFNTAIKLLKKKQAIGLLNGPISKKKFLKKSFSGITEYLKYKTSSNNVAMIIYNRKLSVSPITTHVPIKIVNNKITKKNIIS